MTRPNSVILASGNQKKLKELSQILSDFSMTLIPQSQYQVEDAIEDGLSFVENAIIKARHACTKTGMPSIADDSGIEVDFLDGRPGIYSARFAGENATDEQNLNQLLSLMEEVPQAQRTARYQCVIVYMRHPLDPTPLIAQASWEGLILENPIGDGGFGYDPIFFDPVLKQSAAQLTAEQKAAISHRGKALALFRHAFETLYPHQASNPT